MIILDPQQAGNVLDELDKYPEIALDLETTGLDYHRDDIHGVALATPTAEYYVTLGAKQALLDNLQTILNTKNVIMHNAPFDVHFLERCGLHVPKILDTMVAQYLLDENQGLGLKNLAATKLGIDGDLPGFGEMLKLGKLLTGKRKLEDVNIYDIPLDKVAEYAARDARLTFDLMELSRRELVTEGMWDYYVNTELPFINLLINMESNGFLIDQVRLAELEKEFSGVRNDALGRFMEISGGINPNSPQQLAKFFYEDLGFTPTIFTPGGAPSTDELSLMRLEKQDKTGAANALLVYRKYEKLLNTYIYGFMDRLVNGKLYGRFKHVGTVTGRLASSDPNLQNIPAHGDAGEKVRELFIASDGHVFICIDYSQLELRIAAHYTRDPNLMKVFADNLDPHQMTADLIGAERYIGKTINFSWFYGAGSRKMADTIEKTGKPRPKEKDVKKWIHTFETVAYPTAKEWKNQVVIYARNLGYVKTIGGRKRRLPDLTHYDDKVRLRAERQAINAIIQGSASDIMKYAMINLRDIEKSMEVSLLAQVHDEVDFDTPEEIKEEFAKKAATVMVQAGEHFNMRTALVAEPGIGKSWADAKH